MEKKREKEAQELSSDNMPVERKAHVCQVCQRRFISGKALGGHLSAHLQAKKAKNRFTTLEEEEKHFHPDRGAWRAKAEEIQEEEAAHDVVNLLGHKEDKRIKRGGEENNKGKGTGKAHHHVSGSSSEDDTDEYYCNNHMEEIRINGGILNPKQINYRNKESLMEPESESKNKKRRVLEVESAEKEKNKCNCGRGFSSSQPLGRHKEIMQQQHNNNNNNKVKTEIPNTSNDNDENQSIGVHRRVESRWLLQVASPRIPKFLMFDLNEIPADDAANVDDQFN
ncbi:zinc finger protein ZAT9-like [Ipomoea triloba]|uniref:zinc finger protein ZAT9-like n=1 Tax=Ipomoea triloba TaxID=35885 RepID=UPI00125E4BF3|nr:zinc finger protein ZAT9-like [Ipomoea triloba]